MTLIEYLKQNKNSNWSYVGTIYGPDDWESVAGEEIANFLTEMGDHSPIIDHPATGGRGGFYFQSADIWYHSDLSGDEECVFEAID